MERWNGIPEVAFGISIRCPWGTSAQQCSTGEFYFAGQKESKQNLSGEGLIQSNYSYEIWATSMTIATQLGFQTVRGLVRIEVLVLPAGVYSFKKNSRVEKDSGIDDWKKDMAMKSAKKPCHYDNVMYVRRRRSLWPRE
jgi:hypothetical protein